MAITAGIAKLGLVHILIAVTIHTGHGNFGVGITAVAIAAQGLGMGPRKGKARVLVVVEFCFLPTVIRVAVLALCAKAACMHILDGVAVVAGCRHTLVNFANVTRHAIYFGMLAEQRKFRLAVIEACDLFPAFR